MLMPFSIPLIAALLLAIQIVAPAIGLRSPKNIDEAFGLGASTGTSMLLAIAAHWPLSHFVLQPHNLQFLNILIAVLLIITISALTETWLRNKLPKYFPTEGNLQPQIMTGAFILALPLIQDITLSLGETLSRAALYAIGAKLLIGLFHAIREHSANAETPTPLRGPAIDFISAGLLIAALGGIASVF